MHHQYLHTCIAVSFERRMPREPRPLSVVHFKHYVLSQNTYVSCAHNTPVWTLLHSAITPKPTTSSGVIILGSTAAANTTARQRTYQALFRRTLHGSRLHTYFRWRYSQKIPCLLGYMTYSNCEAMKSRLCVYNDNDTCCGRCQHFADRVKITEWIILYVCAS